MVIFGVRLVCAATNLKCSIIGWPEKPSLPVTCTPSLRVVTAANAMPVSMTVALGAVEAPEEIEMPPGAAELAVGDGLQADLLLLLDDALDLAVFDRLEVGGADLALGALCPRLLQRCGAQQAADMVGAERRLGAFHGALSTLLAVMPANSGHPYARSHDVRHHGRRCPRERDTAYDRCRHPQTSSATSTISRSFAHCSSSARILPSSVEAKPHCGERQS